MTPASSHQHRTANWLAQAALLALCAGCQITSDWMDGSVQGPFHQPSNFHLAMDDWPADVQLVAVMPLVASAGNELAARGVETMQQVFSEALAKQTVFESLTITPEKLQGLVGVIKVRPLEPLPHQFQKVIASLDKANPDRKVCHAVLFCELTRYNPYPPLTLGWRLRAFDLTSGQLIWAFDEVFDAGNPRVTNSARQFFREQNLTSMALFRDTLVVDSPRAFAAYSLSEIFATMQKKKAQVSSQTTDGSSEERQGTQGR